MTEKIPLSPQAAAGRGSFYSAGGEPNPEEPRYLFTEVGVGYRLAEGDAPDAPDAE